LSAASLTATSAARSEVGMPKSGGGCSPCIASFFIKFRKIKEIEI
jgi:hypothetical protein